MLVIRCFLRGNEHMGTYLNPGNSGFADIMAGKYIDKTGLISVLNSMISTPQKLICISRPRRFGKSYAAQMLCAYYDRTAADSAELFQKCKISSMPGFGDYLNRYNVIYLDMAGIKSSCDDFRTLSTFLKERITAELCSLDERISKTPDFLTTLVRAVDVLETKFIMIIDEWDAPVRENPACADEYLTLLRSLFKNSGVTAKLFAAVYMTGILPVKKVRMQSALSDFEEYTMLSPGPFAEYTGFTEEEVKALCVEYDVDFEEMKRWYDGYELRKAGAVYNPNSVMKAIRNDAFDSYWSQSSAADDLLEYIRWDVDGLRQAVIELMGGVKIEIDTTGYNNDLTYTTRDAALTMLAHLGYLAFDQEKKAVRIPNEEIRLEFARALRQTDNPETMKRVRESIQLIMDTIHGEEERVAGQIRSVHMDTSNPLNRNNENSLRAAIQVAYFAYKDYFIKCEELPAGKGYADVVYIPKKGADIPALVVELKWNENADGALRQIRDKEYVNTIEGFGGDVLLVGISYEKGTDEYRCRIEKWDLQV